MLSRCTHGLVVVANGTFLMSEASAKETLLAHMANVWGNDWIPWQEVAAGESIFDPANRNDEVEYAHATNYAKPSDAPVIDPFSSPNGVDEDDWPTAEPTWGAEEHQQTATHQDRASFSSPEPRANEWLSHSPQPTIIPNWRSRDPGIGPSRKRAGGPGTQHPAGTTLPKTFTGNSGRNSKERFLTSSKTTLGGEAGGAASSTSSKNTDHGWGASSEPGSATLDPKAEDCGGTPHSATAEDPFFWPDTTPSWG